MSYNGGAGREFGNRNGGGVRRKWWKPKNDEEAKKFESFKSDVKTFLTICTQGVSIYKAYGEIADMAEGEIPYAQLGFKSFGEFLFHCDDILEVRTDGDRGYYLFLRGQAGEEMEHLRKLVEGQNKKTKYKGFKARLCNTRSCPSQILLEKLRTSEMDKPKPPPNPTMRRKRTNGSQGGNRFGGSSGRSGSSGGRAPSQGLVNYVINNLGFEDESDDEFDDWYCSSSTKVYEPWSEDEEKDGEVLLVPPVKQETNNLASNAATSKAIEAPSQAGANSVTAGPGPNTSRSSSGTFISTAAPVQTTAHQAPIPKSIITDRRPMASPFIRPKTSSAAPVPDLSVSPVENETLSFGSLSIFKGEEFNAEVIGVDGFGFFFLHLDNPEVRELYQGLKNDLVKFYSNEQTRKKYKLETQQIHLGISVVAKVAKRYFRARIHDKDPYSRTCMVVDLDDRDFFEVSFDNIYRLDAQFTHLRNQAIMCCLAGLEEYMMTGEIADAFELTPLSPPNARVKWIGRNEDFDFPIFSMFHGDHNLADLISLYGQQKQLLGAIKSDEEMIQRKKMQQVVWDVLCEKSYLS